MDEKWQLGLAGWGVTTNGDPLVSSIVISLIGLYGLFFIHLDLVLLAINRLISKSMKC